MRPTNLPGHELAVFADPPMHGRSFLQLAIQVMQFRGYIFRVNKKRGYFLVAFGDTMDALRFCHSFQLMIMFITWPPEAEPFCDAQARNHLSLFLLDRISPLARLIHALHLQVIGPDGRYIFNGPRVAMAVNEESSYTAVSLHNNHPHR